MGFNLHQLPSKLMKILWVMMGIEKYREYRQNIGDISPIQGKIWPYPPISFSTLENTDISADISILVCNLRLFWVGFATDL